MKTGLVLEGGAMRGMFTCGVLDVLMENGIAFDGAAGISAGAVFGCNYKSGQIGRAIRYNKKYMFLLEGKKLYVLNGGRIHVAEHPLSYYDEHLSKYISQVRKAFIPYDREKKRLGQIIRMLGGDGSDHGCIVDIDCYNHIYCDPRDGKLSFYYATDIVNKVFYPDLLHLLKESPSLFSRDLLVERLESMNSFSAMLPAVNESVLTSVAPEIVQDTKMYATSRKMRAIQYALEQKVIRLWRDEILEYDFDCTQIKSISDGEEAKPGSGAAISP